MSEIDLQKLAEWLEKVFPNMVVFDDTSNMITVAGRIILNESGVIKGTGPAAVRCQDIYKEFLDSLGISCREEEKASETPKTVLDFTEEQLKVSMEQNLKMATIMHSGGDNMLGGVAAPTGMNVGDNLIFHELRAIAEFQKVVIKQNELILRQLKKMAGEGT